MAKPVDHGRAETQALDLAKQAIALRSVRGPGNQAPQVAALLKSALVSGGFDAADVTITPVDDTAFLIARWKGTDPKLKPLVISGHMDVVEAKPADWERDPFTPVVENGLLYGRGASDMKLDDALAVAAVIELKRQGYKPRRDIVLAFSGDEETTMKTTEKLATALSNAEMVLNVDGTGGQLDPEGKPQYFTWTGAEKTYADFKLTVTSPGGHSSRPYEPNAINQLSAALQTLIDGARGASDAIGAFPGNTHPQFRVVPRLHQNGSGHLGEHVLRFLFLFPQEGIEKFRFARFMTEFTVLEENMHRLPERVIQDFNQFLMNEGIVRGRFQRERTLPAGQSKGHCVPHPGPGQRRFNLGIALGRAEAHHDVLGPKNCLQPRAKAEREIERGKGPFTGDDGMNELHGNMLRIGGAGTAPEGQQASAPEKAFRHFPRGVRQALRVVGEIFLHDLIAGKQSFFNLRRHG